jgi:peptidoglycan/LPS O-acetylase OafA/YrhL
MTTPERRYDIDWLRVIAIGLLLIYHIGIGFQPWGVFIGFIQSPDSLEGLWVPMSMLNIWRIPLLFFVSGMGVCFAMVRRNWKALMLERARRILLPFLFGVIAIVPLHYLLWQSFYRQELAYVPQAGHLWFLANIFAYVVLLAPLFFYLKKQKTAWLPRAIRRWMATPIGWLVMAGVFMLETVLVKPESYELYATTWHGFVIGGLAFLFGFLFVYTGPSFWKNLRSWRWALLALAMGLFLIRYLVFDLEAPMSLKALETCAWVFALLALAFAYLNRPGKALSYLTRAAYPVYILHMVFLYLASYFLMPLELSPWIKLLLVAVLTFGGCLLTYEFLVRRIRILRPLFGLKNTHPSRKKLRLTTLKTTDVPLSNP